MWLATNSGPFTIEELAISIDGLPSFNLLHISDIHFAPGQKNKAAFLRDLSSIKPDLVVNTGDNLGHLNAINPLLQALEPLLGHPGVFVHGSNDYFAPRLKNPARYLLGPSKVDSKPKAIDTDRLTREFEGAGWLNLNNSSGHLEVAGQKLTFAGLDDPHINRDDASRIGVKKADIALLHAPYTKALNELAALTPKLMLAGHTHGGQICLPGGKALVTNCDLPTDKAQGLSEHGSIPLHVSGGLGCSIYAPLRIFCPPTATLIRIN